MCKSENFYIRYDFFYAVKYTFFLSGYYYKNYQTKYKKQYYGKISECIIIKNKYGQQTAYEPIEQMRKNVNKIKNQC